MYNFYSATRWKRMFPFRILRSWVRSVTTSFFSFVLCLKITRGRLCVHAAKRAPIAQSRNGTTSATPGAVIIACTRDDNCSSLLLRFHGLTRFRLFTHLSGHSSFPIPPSTVQVFRLDATETSFRVTFSRCLCPSFANQQIRNDFKKRMEPFSWCRNW